MKKYIINSVIILSTVLFLSGCYTVLWVPEDEFPSEMVTNEYYPETYYGDYYSFYDYPWWLSISPPSAPVGSDYIRNENGTTSSVRNEGQGRGSNDGREILNTTPPTKDASNNNSSNSNSNSSSSKNNSTSVNSNSNESSSRSSDNNSVRNNSGSRNSNSGRR